jgi:hypothetical protein
MARRTRKPKSTKPSRSSGKKKDPVTGLSAEIFGKTVYSDKVYDTTELGWTKASDFSEGGGSYVEYELGRNAITITLHGKGYLDKDEIINLSKESTARFAYLGSFSYNKKGFLLSGYVREAAGWSYSKIKDGGIFEYSDVDMTNYIAVDNLHDITQAWESGQRIFSNITYSDGSFEGDKKDSFYNFESSGYFENGWWDNPFSTNLI